MVDSAIRVIPIGSILPINVPTSAGVYNVCRCGRFPLSMSFGRSRVERERQSKAAILHGQIGQSEGFYACPVSSTSRCHTHGVF